MRKKLLAIALTLALVFSLAACSKTNNNNAGNTTSEENQNSSEEISKGETKVITDARGEVEIPVNPTRIVDLSGTSDILYILGYEVAGTANSDAYDYTKVPSYLGHALKNASILGYSMQDTMDVEGVLALEPDLIIISTVQEKMYEQLAEVAPTVMLEMAQLDWTQDLMNVATVMDKKEEAETWLSEYKTKAEEIGSQIKETYGEDTTYLSFLASGGQLYIFDGAGIGSILYEDLGLAKPEGMPVQENISLPVVTYEGLAAIDADFIIAIGTDEDTAALKDSSIYQGIEAVKNGKVLYLPASPYFNQGYSPIGREIFLDEIIGLLASVNE